MDTTQKRFISIFLMVVLLTSMVNTFNIYGLTDIHINPSADRNLSRSEWTFDEDEASNNYVTVDYSVDFADMPVEDTLPESKEKEVVIVVDTSGSMAYNLNGKYPGNWEESRMDIVKAAAKNFINELDQYSGMKVALIDFANFADVKNSGSPLVDLDTKKSELLSEIDALKASGGTNIGDAIRRGREILSKGSDSADKYFVLLTDGEATAFSYDFVDYRYYYFYANAQDFVNGRFVSKLNWIKDVDYKTRDGLATKYIVGYTSQELLGEFQDYANMMATSLKETVPNVNSYYIAFSNTTAGDALKETAANSGGEHRYAYSADDINGLYQEIANEIVSSYTVKDVSFQEVLPTNVEFVSSKDNVTEENGVMTLDLSNVVFKLNEAKTAYVADPITFSVTVAPTKPGTYTLGSNESRLVYKDIDTTSKTLNFPTKTFIVNEPDPSAVDDNKILNILEIQPGNEFELNSERLKLMFPDAEDIVLTQRAMTQFNGMVDKVNGKYDVVYIGTKGGYDNHRLSNGNYYTSVITDVDVSNKKALDIKEFAESGQLLIYDKSILYMTDSILKKNISELNNRDNVKGINTYNLGWLRSVNEWYGNSVHRPLFSLSLKPGEYDGSRESYESSHIMTFLYDIANKKDHNMMSQLSLDIDGDGLFADDELVYKKESGNASDLAINYSLESGFNGLMPWKLEIVDETTGAKNYQVGFPAYSGKKTIVNVLQICPDYGYFSINDSAKFIKALSTEDYEINVTVMNVEDFDAAYLDWNEAKTQYPREVNGHPTWLNGNYDMLIFGFGDSYYRKDLTEKKNPNSMDAIDAVDAFIATGQSILFTHDTAGPQDWVNNFDRDEYGRLYNDIVNFSDAPNITANFKDDMGFSNTRTSAGEGTWKAWGATEAYKLNEGVITKYPYILANNPDQKLTIATTHDQYWNIDLESEDVVPWFTLNVADLKYYPAAYYYTFTNGNITYSGTGHSTPDGVEEQEFFVNTMLKAARGANHAPTMDITDLYNNMEVSKYQDVIDFKMTIHDIDFKDKEFKSKVYMIVDGQEYLVDERQNLSKDVEYKMVIPKTIVDKNGKTVGLTKKVDDFEIKVVAEDSHGAQGQQSFKGRHVDGPILKVTDNAKGYLIGDAFDLTYTVSAEDENDLEYITDVNLNATIDSSYLSVTDSTGWSVSGNTYTTKPTFKTDALTYEPSSNILKLKANTVGTEIISMSGTYDITGDSNKNRDNVSFSKLTSIEIKEGQFIVTLKDENGAVVNGATVVVKDMNGDILSTQKTVDSGMTVFEKMKSGTYSVELSELPEGYDYIDDNPKKELTLSFSHNSINVEFDVHTATHQAELPTIVTDYTNPFNQSEDNTDLEVHLMFDGVSSEMELMECKQIENGTTITAEDFAGAEGEKKSLGDVSDKDGKEIFKDNDPSENVSYQSFSVSADDLSDFKATFAIYGENEEGKAKVLILEVKFVASPTILADYTNPFIQPDGNTDLEVDLMFDGASSEMELMECKQIENGTTITAEEFADAEGEKKSLGDVSDKDGKEIFKDNDPSENVNYKSFTVSADDLSDFKATFAIYGKNMDGGDKVLIIEVDFYPFDFKFPDNI